MQNLQKTRSHLTFVVNKEDCLKQRCFKMGRERMETRKVIKQLKAQCENTDLQHRID